MNAISVEKSETKAKNGAPHVCCAKSLREWLNNKGRSMPFALPMIWREPTDHLTDCYFVYFRNFGTELQRKIEDCRLSQHFVCYSTGTPH